MSITEILEELPKLSGEELDVVRRKLDELHGSVDEETPELLAAIDEGIRSADEEPLIPIEEVMREVRSWSIPSK
jgi:predicted transcriptional regulator